MYKALSSFWSKPSSKKVQLSSDTPIDEDSWVFVNDTAIPATIKPLTNSWIEPISSNKTDQSTTNVHHFNPIENLLIEHASMSVYEQIAPKTRNRRQRKPAHDNKLDEQVEDEEDEDDVAMNHHHSTLTSIHNRNMNMSSNSFITTLESSTQSLTAHHRHLQRLHQRRKRSNKSTLPDVIDEQPKQEFNENIELQSRNHHKYSTNKIILQPMSHLHHD